jgi:hypothetical protein
MPKVITETPILPAAPQPGIAAPTPIQKPQVSLDEPIAFIRADSLEQPKNTQNDQKS